jgi:ABC-type sugar transport system substrate-binding protein
MKRTLAILLTVLLAVSVFGCTPAQAPAATEAPAAAATNAPAAEPTTAPPAEKQYIALCIAQASNEFQSKIKDAMQVYIDDNKLAEKYDFTFFDADFDTATQLQQVENAIAQGADALVMIAVDAEGSMAAVNAANEAGVPIIGCNTEVSDNSKLTSYVGSDCLNLAVLK